VDVTVSARHTDVTDGLKSYAVEKAGRLSRHFDRSQSAEVVLNVEDDRMIAEIILPLVKHKVLTAKAVEKDMYAAIDAVMDKIDRQLRKFKERLSDRRAHGFAHEGEEGTEATEEESGSGASEDN
jgi:putative sigma-54 modulation protein